MARKRNDDPVPDRLTAVLEELEAVRRAPGWLPAEEDVIDEPRSRVAQLPRRVAATARRSADTQDAAAPAADATAGDGPAAARHARHAARSGSDELRPHRPLLRPPEPLLGAQVAPSRLAVIGAVVLVLIAAVVFGGRVLWARTSATPQPVAASGPAMPSSGGAASRSGSANATRPASVPASGPGAGFAPSPGAAPPASASVLVVQVVGQVHRPGVVQVRAGSRVQDVVAAAGGALPGADLAAINLARPVTDGEQIQVPKPGEQVTAAPGAGAAGGAATGPAAGAGGSSAPAVVDLNSADVAALDTLPGVGPVLAQRIVQWRTDNGRFTSIDELGEVSGIGDKLLAQLTPLVRIG